VDLHERILTDNAKSNNSVEVLHHAFQGLLGVHSQSLWRLIAALKKEQILVQADITPEQADHAYLPGQEMGKKLVVYVNRRMRVQRRSICLFIDNCPAHPNLNSLSNVKLVFLLPNTTSKLQPMDQGIIQNFKLWYRHLVLQKLIIAVESRAVPAADGDDCLVFFKFSLLDAMAVVRTAWQSVTPATIHNCFCHTGFKEQAWSVEASGQCPSGWTAGCCRLLQGV
jgi:hypothetical protein